MDLCISCALSNSWDVLGGLMDGLSVCWRWLMLAFVDSLARNRYESEHRVANVLCTLNLGRQHGAACRVYGPEEAIAVALCNPSINGLSGFRSP